MLRAEPSSLRAAPGGIPVERVDQHDRVSAARRQSPRLVDRALDGLGLGVRGDGEADRRDRLDRPCPQSVISSGRTPARTSESWMSSCSASVAASRRSASVLPARARSGDRHPRSAAERRQPLDRLDRRIVGAEPETLARERGREILEARAVGDLLGGTAVDRVDPDHRREPLGPARRSPGTRDPVALHELAPLDLRRRDVHVVLRRLGRMDAQKARAVRQQLDLALDDLVLVGTLGRLRLDRGLGLLVDLLDRLRGGPGILVAA